MPQIKYMHMLNAIKENMTGHILRNSKSIERKSKKDLNIFNKEIVGMDEG